MMASVLEEIRSSKFSFMLPKLKEWPEPYSIDIHTEPTTKRKTLRILWEGYSGHLCQLTASSETEFSFCYYRNGVVRKLTWEDLKRIPTLIVEPEPPKSGN